MESMSGIYHSSLKLIVCLIAFAATAAHGRTLEIGPGKEFATLEAACANSQPGDTLLFVAGVHEGGGHITTLKGTEEKPIVIRGEANRTSIIRGGTSAFQLSNPVYVTIEGLVFEDQTGNGVNIDDGGTYWSPARYITFDNCEWRGMNATGNNDELKLSGVSRFTVKNCTFMNGAEGGSLVDMVGCFFGTFENNTFQNAGSNCIQAKGGSANILIQRNRFLNGGQRAINIGGSTAMEFFRPAPGYVEAYDVSVEANLFEGGVSAIAFVGSENCRANSNTIIRPEQWAVRILKENLEEGMRNTNKNDFIDNIVVFTSTKPAINIGPNTEPQTFNFLHNLWYNPDDPNWGGPDAVALGFGTIVQKDPKFIDLQYHLDPTSPAAGAGHFTTHPEYDLYGKKFANPRSIGAVEVTPTNAVMKSASPGDVSIFPNPATSMIQIEVSSLTAGRIIDVTGREVWNGALSGKTFIDVSSWPAGAYSLQVGSKYYSVMVQ
jgi:hypothetical protein